MDIKTIKEDFSRDIWFIEMTKGNKNHFIGMTFEFARDNSLLNSGYSLNKDKFIKFIEGKKKLEEITVFTTDTFPRNKIYEEIFANHFYKAEDVAKMLEVNIMTIYRYIDAGKIKAYKIGKEYRIDKREVSSFLDNVRTK